jgi:hypothetical protein
MFTNQNQTFIVDEFGRDLSLRNEDAINAYRAESYISSLLSLSKTMSWAELDYMLEEKEECENQAKKKQLTIERKVLLQQGQYELEDGEVFE